MFLLLQVLLQPLTPSEGFTAMLLFLMLGQQLSWFPEQVNQFVRATVSYRRIEAFLHEETVHGLHSVNSPEEINPAIDLTHNPPVSHKDGSVSKKSNKDDKAAAAFAFQLCDVALGWKASSSSGKGEEEGRSTASTSTVTHRLRDNAVGAYASLVRWVRGGRGRGSDRGSGGNYAALSTLSTSTHGGGGLLMEDSEHGTELIGRLTGVMLRHLIIFILIIKLMIIKLMLLHQLISPSVPFKTYYLICF